VVSGSADAVSTVEGVTPDIIAAGVDAMKSVYADAFRLVFLVSLAFGGRREPLMALYDFPN
jgi:hypothetical protein